jgi:hypothetical protein
MVNHELSSWQHNGPTEALTCLFNCNFFTHTEILKAGDQAQDNNVSMKVVAKLTLDSGGV